MRILYVDDSATDLLLFEHYAESLGHDVICSHCIDPHLATLSAIVSRKKVPFTHVVLDWFLLPLDMAIRDRFITECGRLGIRYCIYTASGEDQRTNIPRHFTVFRKTAGLSVRPDLVHWLANIS